uniref:Uncharacterized protein n=1 Tax=Coptotermes formosanus TaxID=36987 RepID=R4V454_COPFO|nr:hypothetical protein [Coptotermes formosanus]
MSYIKAMGFEVKCVRVLDRMPCCCCSCDLKVATCVLGWLVLIADVGNFLRSAVGLVMFQDLKDVPPQDTPAFLSSALIVSAIGVLVSGLLLYGAHNERPGFMLPFVILQMIGIVASALIVVGVSIFLFTVNILAGFLMLGIGGLCVALDSFFWVVIYSYYRKLEEHCYPYCGTCPDAIVTG